MAHSACPKCGAALGGEITIQISAAAAELLELLTRGEHAPARDLPGVLRHLVASAADGIRRPGSWERGWVLQAFGDSFEAHVEPDPECRWQVRPRREASE